MDRENWGVGKKRQTTPPNSVPMSPSFMIHSVVTIDGHLFHGLFSRNSDSAWLAIRTANSRPSSQTSVTLAGSLHLVGTERNTLPLPRKTQCCGATESFDGGTLSGGPLCASGQRGFLKQQQSC
jgi:hypothetical protein